MKANIDGQIKSLHIKAKVPSDAEGETWKSKLSIKRNIKRNEWKIVSHLQLSENKVDLYRQITK